MAKVEFETIFDAEDKLFKGLEFTNNNSVYVGITQEKTKREEQEMTNAELLFIHTNGSPINNIPARPVIEPALQDDAERLSDMLSSSAQEAMDGNFEKSVELLKKTGMRGQNVSRAWFVSPKNNWPPNSPGVQKAKRKKGSNNPRPLINTGELRKSITYFVDIGGEKR